MRSSATNQAGAEIITHAAMPRHRKNAPTMNAIADLLFAATKYAARAPQSIPSACARKGHTKGLGSKRWIDVVTLSALFLSTLAGG